MVDDELTRMDQLVMKGREIGIQAAIVAMNFCNDESETRYMLALVVKRINDSLETSLSVDVMKKQIRQE